MKLTRKHMETDLWQKVVETILERNPDRANITAIMNGNRNQKVDVKVTNSPGKSHSFTSVNKFRSDFTKEYYLSNFQNIQD